MVEITTFKKNKIELSEYDYSKDIHNRVLMATFTPLDVEVLEEILYSSLRIPLTMLEKNLDLSSTKLLPILQKLSPTKLFSLESDHVVVDKEMRKYYEFQVLKFEEDFKPGMEYFQGLLRKVPIHILPTWYAISRTSNNIFESIIEKYLFTPQIFQRYLVELNLNDPVQKGIMNAVYQSPNYEVDADDMISKFSLTREQFEEHMLHLEFRFVCCTTFRKEGNVFKEIICPLHEWQEYLCHVRDTEPSPIIDEEKIKRTKTSDFAFIEDMAAILEILNKAPIRQDAILHKCKDLTEEEVGNICNKLSDLNLAEKKDSTLQITSDGALWLKMQPIEKALFLYRHPLNSLKNKNFPEELCQERTIREAEKCISRIAGIGWIVLEDFLKGIFIPLNEEQMVTLKRIGRKWKYELPSYSQEQSSFFKAIIKQWLYEVGMVAIGTKDGHDCFCVTSLGNDLFGQE